MNLRKFAIVVLAAVLVAALFGCNAAPSTKQTEASRKPTQNTEDTPAEDPGTDAVLTKDYYTLEDFEFVDIFGNTTYSDLCEQAPDMSFDSETPYGRCCEYPMEDGGAVCIKFGGEELFAFSVETVYPATAFSESRDRQEQNILDIVTKRYSEEELNAICEATDSIVALHKQYPIECIKDVGDSYRVAYLGEKHIAVLYFDKQGVKVSGRVVSLSVKKDCFTDLIGTHVEEVQKIDPNGSYYFLYTGLPHNESPHYTEDGYLVWLEYDFYRCVEKVSIELI